MFGKKKTKKVTIFEPTYATRKVNVTKTVVQFCTKSGIISEEEFVGYVHQHTNFGRTDHPFLGEVQVILSDKVAEDEIKARGYNSKARHTVKDTTDMYHYNQVYKTAHVLYTEDHEIDHQVVVGLNKKEIEVAAET